MQTMEESRSVGLARFSSLVYLYTGLGVALWTLITFALAKNQSISMPLLMWQSEHSFMSLAVIFGGLVLSSMMCRAFVRRSYFMTFVSYLMFIVCLSVPSITMFYAFRMDTIIKSFITTAIVFIVAAGYGYVSKKDLSSWGRTLMMTLIMVIVVSAVNTFLLHSGTMFLLINIACVVLFMFYIAYDSHRVKILYDESEGQNLGALALYASMDLVIDFVNLLLTILQIFGIFDND